MLSVIHDKSVLASVDIREISLYKVLMLLSLFGLGRGMMLSSFYTWGMMFVLSVSV